MTEREHYEKDVTIKEKGQAPTGGQTLQSERGRFVTGVPLTSNVAATG